MLQCRQASTFGRFQQPTIGHSAPVFPRQGMATPLPASSWVPNSTAAQRDSSPFARHGRSFGFPMAEFPVPPRSRHFWASDDEPDNPRANKRAKQIAHASMKRPPVFCSQQEQFTFSELPLKRSNAAGAKPHVGPGMGPETTLEADTIEQLQRMTTKPNTFNQKGSNSHNTARGAEQVHSHGAGSMHHPSFVFTSPCASARSMPSQPSTNVTSIGPMKSDTPITTAIDTFNPLPDAVRQAIGQDMKYQSACYDIVPYVSPKKLMGHWVRPDEVEEPDDAVDSVAQVDSKVVAMTNVSHQGFRDFQRPPFPSQTQEEDIGVMQVMNDSYPFQQSPRYRYSPVVTELLASPEMEEEADDEVVEAL
eukprot:m.29216 g.29216  ORF g.29216 m.29216 type:complete len:363 (+) comp9144_c0_seq2:346-1434(+)